jgi:hypothetical protein
VGRSASRATLGVTEEVRTNLGLSIFSVLKYFDHGDTGRLEPPPLPRRDQPKPLPPPAS